MTVAAYRWLRMKSLIALAMPTRRMPLSSYTSWHSTTSSMSSWRTSARMNCPRRQQVSRTQPSGISSTTSSVMQPWQSSTNWRNTMAETIEEQIIHREQREKLLRQIESLEKQCRTEKQTRKKYELHQQIIKLKTLIS